MALAGCSTVTSHFAGQGETFETSKTPAEAVEGQGEAFETPKLPTAAVNGPATASSQDGVLYFLPRQLARVTAKRTEKGLAGAIAALGKSQDDLRDAKAEVSRIEGVVNVTQNQIIAGDGGDAAKPILAARLAELKAALDKANKDVDAKQATFEEKKKALQGAISVQRGVEIYKDADEQERQAREGLVNANAAQAAPIRARDKACSESGALSIKISDLKSKNADDPQLTALESELPRLVAICAQAEGLREVAVDLVARRMAMLADSRRNLARLGDLPIKPDYATTLKIELLPPSADPDQAFRLDPKHFFMRDDEHTLTVGSNGLLASTDIVATDRTIDALVEIATFAGAVTAVGAKAVQSAVNACGKVPDEYTGLVDFASDTSVRDLNVHLQCLGLRANAQGRRWSPESRPGGNSTSADIQGIVYRDPVEVTIVLERCGDSAGECANTKSGWVETGRLPLALPQAGPISFLRQRAGFGTRTSYANTFQDGMLTNYADNRPSEGFQVLGAPMRLLTGFFDGFSKVISFRTGRESALAGLSTSQLAVLNAQFDYKAGQLAGGTKLSNAEKDLLNARIALQSAATNGEATLTQAQIDLLSKQVALQVGQFNGQTNVATAQSNLLTAQTALATGANSATVQLSASELAQAIALLRDRVKTQKLQDCIAQQGNAAIDTCLP